MQGGRPETGVRREQLAGEELTMTGLIDSLTREHEAILAALDRVGRAGIDSPEGRQHLLEALSRLLAHLNREQERLFRCYWRKQRGIALSRPS